MGLFAKIECYAGQPLEAMFMSGSCVVISDYMLGRPDYSSPGVATKQNPPGSSYPRKLSSGLWLASGVFNPSYLPLMLTDSNIR